MAFRRTEPRIGASEAKNREETDFEVRFHVAPQKLDQNCKKQFP